MTIKAPNRAFIISWLYFFFSCSTSPQESIVKRWKAVDIKGSMHEDFLRHKEEKAVELEFTKDSKLNFYQNGILVQSMPYMMASDGKSVLLTDPTGRENASIEIISLSSDKLQITAEKIFQRDTVFFEAQ